jgi:hypothetical protein
VNGLLVSEVRKVTSLKFWWALLIAPVVIGGFASAIYASIASSSSVTELGIEGEISMVGLFVTIAATTLFAAVFGAVNAAGELRHHTITTSFLSSSGRGGVIGTKLAVTAIFGLAYALVAQIISIISMLLFGIGTFEVTGFVVQVFLLGLLVTTIWTVIGAGLGLLFASPTWAAVTLVVWIPVGESIVVAILSGIDAQPLAQFLPGMSTISTLAAGSISDGDPFLGSVAGTVVLILWAVVFGGAGWLRTQQRDIA